MTRDLRRPLRAVLAVALLLSGAPAALAQGPAAPPAAPARHTERGAQRAAAARAEIEQEIRPFFEEHLPEPLLREGPRGLLWWQWIALPGVLLLAVALGSILGWITRGILNRLAARTRTTWDDVLLERVGAPLTALWAVLLVAAFQPWLVLPSDAATVLQHVLRAATYLAVFWAGFRSVNVAFALAAETPWGRASASLGSFLPLFRKIAKVVLLALGVVAVLNELGFQVASLLAGVGIGGIAIALAAQKTVENLFGSVSISVDQPFRVGDFVKVDDISGTVESIGMRSTRIRTLDRTIVTIPNGKLADMRAETFAVRDRIRLLANLGVSYATRADQMRHILAGVEALLRGHAKIQPDSVSVRFSAFNESALNLEVVATFRTADWNEFTLLRQDLFLAFMEVVEKAGAAFAFPTRTVRLERVDAPHGANEQAPR